MVANTTAFGDARKSLLGLQNELVLSQKALKVAQAVFSADLAKTHNSLQLAEARYRSLEANALMEVDKERQSRRQVEAQLKLSNKDFLLARQKHHREVSKLNKTVSALNQKNSHLKGELSVSKTQITKLERAAKRLTTRKIEN